MSLVRVSSSTLFALLPTPSSFRLLLSSSPLMKSQQLFSAPSCFQLLGGVHFHSKKHIFHLELRRLLAQKSISGFHNLDDAFSLYREMLHMRPLPYDLHFNQLLTALVKMQQYPVAISLFAHMSSLPIPVDIITWNIAINCYCHCDRVDYAFSLLAAIFKRGFVPDVITYTTLIRGLLSHNKSAEAELFFTNLIRFEQVQPDVVTFTTMIHGLCKTGHTHMAFWLFQFMDKCDCKPNTVTYNTVIDSLCKCALVDDALNLYSKMIDNAIFPDVQTYSPIVQVLGRLNRWEEVSLLLKQMIEDMHISPDVHIFNILVDAHSKSGKLDDANWIIGIMNGRGQYPDIVTYTTLMQAYCSQGQMDEALAVFNDLSSKQIVPDAYTYNILLDAYCKELQVDIAMDLYRNMASEGLTPTTETHNILLHGLCRLGQSMEALTFFYKIQDQGYKPDNVNYRTMLGGLCKNQYVNEALSLFQVMRCSGLILESKTFNIIIRGCLENKKYNEAHELIDNMVDCGFSADATTTSFLKHLLLSELQDPTLIAMHQKCLHSGVSAGEPSCTAR